MENTILPEPHEVSYEEIKVVLANLEGKHDDKSSLIRRYYKDLLAYKREEEKLKLQEQIKRKLGVDYASGFFVAQDISKVLGIPTNKVHQIEDKITRLLKHPDNSRKFKNYIKG